MRPATKQSFLNPFPTAMRVRLESVVIFLNSFAMDLLSPLTVHGEVMVLGPVVCGLVIVLPALRIVMQICFKAPGAFWGLGAA